MSITGAKFLGDQFKNALADVKAKLNQAGDDMSRAMAELHSTAATAQDAVKQVETETAELKAALGQVTNGGPQ